MTDFQAMGLRCGLEIHQQLSSKKLFCECSTGMQEQTEAFVIRRKQRAVAGESGAVDEAARAEGARNRTFVYKGFMQEACLVDTDEEPPHAVNQEALTTALGVAKALKLWIPSSIIFMRKTITDGSVTSAFQRTALVGLEGPESFLETSVGPVKLLALGLEEDACKIVEQKHDEATYSLSRLGVPLLELSTGPDIKSPEHMKEVAQKLGLFLRSFPAVKRGLGTIRQDVNVSIKDGARVEIKGAQDLAIMSTIVEYEATRQSTLASLAKEMKRQGVTDVKPHIVDVTQLFRKTEAKMLANVVGTRGQIGAMKFPKSSGFLGRDVQPGRRFGSELSDHAKIASGVGGLFHSDELPKYGISQSEVDAVRRELKCESHDGFIIVAATHEQVARAFAAIVRRFNQALLGVPSEVRKANPDGTSSYLRPMPGAARMYPETDVKRIPVTKELLDAIVVPKLVAEKTSELQSAGLGKDLAEKLGKSRRYDLFERICAKNAQLKKAYVAEILVGAETQIKREKGKEVHHSDEEYEMLFHELAQGRIAKESVIDILAAESKITAQSLSHHHVLSDKDLEKRLLDLIAQHPALEFKQLIGKAMEALRGKAEGQKIVSVLQRLKK